MKETRVHSKYLFVHIISKIKIIISELSINLLLLFSLYVFYMYLSNGFR